MRIVIADAHAMLRDGLRPYLSRIGESAEVFDAATLDDLLVMLGDTHASDMVLINPRISHLPEAHTLEILRQQHPQVRVVVLAEITSRKAIQEALALGVAGYIPKQLSAESMLTALRLILAGERYIPAAVLVSGPEVHRFIDEPDDQERGLTQRESEILGLLRDGLPNKLIARRLNVAEVTVKSHLCHIFRKLGVQNRLQAAGFTRAAV